MRPCETDPLVSRRNKRNSYCEGVPPGRAAAPGGSGMSRAKPNHDINFNHHQLKWVVKWVSGLARHKLLFLMA